MGNLEQLELEFNKSPKLIELFTVQEIFEDATESLLKRLNEDKRYERKPPRIHPQQLCEWFSMYANTSPEGGLIAVGVADNKTWIGCSEVGAKRLNELEKTAMEFCLDAKHECKRIPVKRPDGNDDFILLFRIYYNEYKLVETFKGDAFVRFGDSKHQLTEEEKREVRADKGQLQFELEPARDYRYPEDFDTRLVKVFAEKFRLSRRLTERPSDVEVLVLRRLGKITKDGFEPNVACVLLFANDPQRLIPGCKVQFTRFDGDEEGTGEKYNAVKELWAEGNVPTLITETERIVTSQLREFSRLGPDNKFYTASEYPPAAWYEAVVNACAHRSYSLRNMSIFVKMFDNRLEIQSPGGFPPMVTPETIYNSNSHPRNRNLMDALYFFDLVKIANEGARRMREAMTKANLPEPEFLQKEASVAMVRVTLRNNVKHRREFVDRDAIDIVGEESAKNLDEIERRILNFVCDYGQINVTQARSLGLRDWHSARKRLLKLVEAKILRRIGRTDIERDSKSFYVLAKPPAKPRAG